MTHSVGEVLSDSNNSVKRLNNHSVMRNHNNQPRKTVGVMGSRRIFAATFKLKVLDSYRSDIECRGNQRATARKYGIHRRQIQKWLQCEKNLRNSCTENTNRNGVIVSKCSVSGTTVNSNGINIISTAMSKTSDPRVVTTSSGRASRVPTPATSASALNLSLARLRGDELTTRQGPPLHPTSHRASPTSVQYTPQTPANPLSMQTLLIGYTDFPGQDVHDHQHHHQLSHHRIQNNTVSGYQIDRAGSPTERKYFVVSHPAYEQSQSTYSGSDVQLYHQPQQASYLANPGHVYNGTLNTEHRILGRITHQSPSHVSSVPVALSTTSSSSSPHSHLRDVDAPGNDSVAPAIKTERASPDSPATSVSCDEAPSSPRITTTTRPLYPVKQHIFIPTSGVTMQPDATTNIHFETPRRIDPGTHVQVDTHTSMDFTIQRHHTEIVYVKGNDEGKSIKDEIQDTCVLTKESTNDQPNYVISENRISSYAGDVGMECNTCDVLVPQSNSQIRSVTSSPARGSNFSDPLSPKGTFSISSRSTSSCSDGEVDATEYSSIHQNPSSELSRRRSFSLRFKLDVLDAFHGDAVVARNQRATARKFGINRRQVQKWLGQETELRGEIALRGGDLRQRLGPLQELVESAVDLRTNSIARTDIKMDPSSPPYCCDSSSQRLGYYSSMLVDSESPQRSCLLSCCTDAFTPASLTPCYSESQGSYYCASPKDSIDVLTLDSTEVNSSQSKQTTCNCCYDTAITKRLYEETIEFDCSKDAENQPPQEAPLCLVKNKYPNTPSPLQAERVTSTVPTPPAPAIPASSKKDGILFKPYLDNPVSKPTDEIHHDYRDLTNLHGHPNVIVQNNNCNSICNLNEEAGHDYAVELSLRMPISWRGPSYAAEFPEGIRSAFARYPAASHYI